MPGGERALAIPRNWARAYNGIRSFGVKLLIAIIFFVLCSPATAQVPQQDPCVGFYGFAREDCIAKAQQAAQDAERQKQLQQELQQQLLREQILSHQLQNEMLRRRLESEDAAKKKTGVSESGN